MLKSESYLERGDAPAQAVLRANAEQKAVRKAIETQEELHKIRERVCITLSAYEVGEELAAQSQNNVEDKKNTFVKEDTELEFVDDMATLYLILSDPIAKRKYQQKVTIFVVGYENLCSHRNKLLLQLQQFFTQNTASDDSFTASALEFDFDEVENNVRDALNKAEKTTERLASISKDVLKVFEMVNPKDHKKGKKKLEKLLFQSQQDVMHLTEKLVGVQSDLEDTKTRLSTLNKQLEVKEADIERLKAQVNVNKAFENECNNLRKGLQAKEQQLQTYRTQMDEVELSLSHAESKYDEYVEMCRNLRDENEHLKDNVETRTKEQEERIMGIRKDLETKHENEMNELKASQEEEIARIKEGYEDELLTLKEKLDAMKRRSLATATTSAPSLLPESRDSARFSSTESEYASRAVSTWRSSAKTATTILEMKTAETSRLNTASSEAETKGKDSVLERSSSIFVSMSDTPVPKTPKTADTLRPSVSARSGEASPVPTAEISTQTDDVIDNLADIGEISEVKTRTDLLQIEREMAKTPTNELPQKLDEYKSKFAEIEQQLQDDVLQWKLRFNTKAQALNELMLTQEKQLKEKDELMEKLSTVEEQKLAAEKEAEKAILQLEALRAEKDDSVPIHVEEDSESAKVVQTENKETATSASLYRMQNIMDAQETLQSSVGIQCPSTQVSRKPSMRSPQYSDLADEQEMLLFGGGLNASDSGFGGSSNVLLPEDAGILQHETDHTNFASHPHSPSSIASSGPVRSRLVRSALRENRVVLETVRTYEMITEFKMNIVIWLEQHGLGHKSELLTTIPDVVLNKGNELDVLSKMSAIRDTTEQVLNALWQVTKDDYSWSQYDLIDGCEQQDENRDSVVHPDDVGIEVDTKEDNGLLSSPVAKQHGDTDNDVKVESQEHNLQDRSVQTSSRRAPRPTPTTPKGYTRLLHEYNNLSEEYSTLTQQLQDNVKLHQEQIGENANVMNEMQETINNLRSQMMDGNVSGRMSTPPSISSLMFTRLDAERNVRSMKRAVQTKRLSQDSYNTVIDEMNQYVSLPGRRLAELVKRYRHHCVMKDVEESLNLVRMVSGEVYDLQEKMEDLQKARAMKWSEKMAELGTERNELGNRITSSLKEIEDNSGIFLIKPVYSYVSRPEVERSTHPVICKKRPPLSQETPSKNTYRPGYSLETLRTPVWRLRQNIDRPMWISQDSHVTDSGTPFDDNPMPRLLAMDVNRFTLSKNLISGSIDMTSGNAGVRQYVTLERPIGTSKPLQVDRATRAPTPPSHDPFPVDSCSSSPSSFTPYPPLPPINLPHSHVSSATSTSNQTSSISAVTSCDENFAR